MENINKENFFNGMMEKYPQGTQKFCDWIDNYKDEVNWRYMFDHEKDIKFHDLPFEMQKGIIHRFVRETANQDMINFTQFGLMVDFEKVLEHLNDKAVLKSMNG